MFYSVVPFYTRVRSYSTRTLLFRGSIFDAGTLLLQRHSYLIDESKYTFFNALTFQSKSKKNWWED